MCFWFLAPKWTQKLDKSCLEGRAAAGTSETELLKSVTNINHQKDESGPGKNSGRFRVSVNGNKFYLHAALGLNDMTI